MASAVETQTNTPSRDSRQTQPQPTRLEPGSLANQFITEAASEKVSAEQLAIKLGLDYHLLFKMDQDKVGDRIVRASIADEMRIFFVLKRLSSRSEETFSINDMNLRKYLDEARQKEAAGDKPSLDFNSILKVGSAAADIVVGRLQKKHPVLTTLDQNDKPTLDWGNARAKIQQMPFIRVEIPKTPAEAA